jgi:hypothetical protein
MAAAASSVNEHFLITVSFEFFRQKRQLPPGLES